MGSKACREEERERGGPAAMAAGASAGQARAGPAAVAAAPDAQALPAAPVPPLACSRGRGLQPAPIAASPAEGALLPVGITTYMEVELQMPTLLMMSVHISLGRHYQQPLLAHMSALILLNLTC